MAIQHLLNLLANRIQRLPILILYLTDGCNSRCVTCDIWRNPRRNMPAALLDGLADAAPTLGVRWVVLSGGEAMQHPDWAGAARRFRAAGVRVFLLTNGLYVAKHADAVAAHVDELIVSLDAGDAPTYCAIRGVDAFDVVLDGIRAASERGVRVTTRTTVQRANFRQMPRIIDAAKAAGARSISFLAVDVSNPFAFGTRVAHPGALLPDDLPALADVLDALERDYAADFAARRIAEAPAKLRRLHAYFAAVNGLGEFPPVRCNAPHTSAVIEVDGTLRPCYFLPSAGRTDGHDARAALNRDAMRDLRRAYAAGERAECAQCVCPLYKSPRALLAL